MATMPIRKPTLPALLWLGVCVLGACSDADITGSGSELTQGTTQQPVGNAGTGNPLAGVALYGEAQNSALATASAWRSTRPDAAALVERIGRTPQAVWFNGWHPDVRSGAASYVAAAAAASALPVLVAYNIPQRDCGLYSAGGSSSAEAYLAWLRDLAAGIGNRRAIVILEPDALGGMDCLSQTDRTRRLAMLHEAVNILKGNSATHVYVDAGHPRWINATEMATRLRAANIANSDGFALNVSNFIGNAENVSYGEALSALTGGKHFVIDTGRNGQGPTAGNEWCNPAGRGLGALPTTATGHQLVDALLWVKRPGESDGNCSGGPSAGVWWPEYALGLAERATTVMALR